MDFARLRAPKPLLRGPLTRKFFDECPHSRLSPAPMKKLHFLGYAQLLCALSVSATPASTFCNGQVIADAAGTYYPSGAKATDTANGLTYYPNGTLIKDAQGVIRFPNGQIARDTQLHYPTGQPIRGDQGTVFYANGKKLKDAQGCYDETGVKLDACPATRELAVPILFADGSAAAAQDIAALTLSILDLNTIQPRFDYRTEVTQKTQDFTMHYRIDIRAGEVFGIEADCSRTR